MNSTLQINEEQQCILPPKIYLNVREKIESERIPVNEIALPLKEKVKSNAPLVYLSPSKPPPKPKPRHHLSIILSPDELYFIISDSIITKRLRVWNGSAYSIYVHICGLWDATARLGAGWQCYPRTRFLLAPGLAAEMFIKVTPRKSCPVPWAYAGLQLAAAHMRDYVTAYFVVPIKVVFQNYVPPNLCEGDG